jgi:hypothetical protein
MPLPLALIAAALEIAKLAAPRLITHLTDSEKAGETAERVIEVAQQVTGTATPNEALARLKADPNLVLQANLRMQEIEAETEKAYLADRQGARARDVELAKAGMRNKRADVMVIGVTTGLIVCLGVLALYRKEMPGEVVGILSMIAGIFGSCLKDAFAFEFGSSRGSKEKDALMAQQIAQR